MKKLLFILLMFYATQSLFGLGSKNSIKELVSLDQNIKDSNASIFVKSYHKDIDGGGGIFYYKSNLNKSKHNGGTFICKDIFPNTWTVSAQQEWFEASSLVGTGCWVRQYDSTINVSFFGAKGDGTTDDTKPIQNAINTTKGVVEFDRKTYMISGININVASNQVDGGNTGVTLKGASFPQRFKKDDINKFFGTVLKLKLNSNKHLLTIDSVGTFTFGAVTIENMLLDGTKGSQINDLDNISIVNIKDIVLRNLFIFNASRDGISFRGSNNQVLLDGFIEVYNCGRDGIWGGGIGDGQWPGTVRCQNNGRYGFYMAAGQLNAFTIYTYFNGNSGLRWSSNTNSHITYLRSEDNNKHGMIYNGTGLTIDHATVPDNGAVSEIASERVGILNQGKDLFINTLYIPDRHNVDVPHNQKWAYYEDGSSIGGAIGSIINQGYGLNNIEDEAPFKIAETNRNSRGIKIGKRKVYENNYTDTTPLLLVGLYSNFKISNCASSFILPTIYAGSASHGLEVEYSFTASSNITISFGTDYLTSLGSKPNDLLLESGETASIKITRDRLKWIVLYAVVQ